MADRMTPQERAKEPTEEIFRLGAYWALTDALEDAEEITPDALRDMANDIRLEYRDVPDMPLGFIADALQAQREEDAKVELGLRLKWVEQVEQRENELTRTVLCLESELSKKLEQLAAAETLFATQAQRADAAEAEVERAHGPHFVPGIQAMARVNARFRYERDAAIERGEGEGPNG